MSDSPQSAGAHPPDESLAKALTPLGWNDRVSTLFEPWSELGCLPGRVARVDRDSSLVVTGAGTIRAEPASHLLRDAEGAEALPTVGDWVAVRPRGGTVTAAVEAVLPRTSAFKRFHTRAGRGELQVLAANIDTVFVVLAAGTDPSAPSAARRRAAIQPDGRVRRLDRELAQAFESGAAPAIVLTKADLCRDRLSTIAAVEAVAGSVPVHLTSGIDGEGIDALARYAEGNHTVALIGASGVGKSTLVNWLVGAQVLAVSEVRAADARGQHTTTARHLIALPGGGALIDTPGLRSVGLWDADEAISQVFADVEELSAACRFRDCRHRGEPGCAVLAAVAAGSLKEARLDSYRFLGREAARLERRQDNRARAENRKQAQVRGRAYRKRGRQRAKQQWRDG